MFSQEYLHKILEYSPSTGEFKWKNHKHNTIKGKIAGYKNFHGYNEIQINGKGYSSSKLAWVYIYGIWPSKIDHKNSIRDDDRLENLREATCSENNCNRCLSSLNTSGIKGLSINSGYRWSASITKDGKRIIKYFKLTDKDKAIKWLRETRENLHGEFTNHG